MRAGLELRHDRIGIGKAADRHHARQGAADRRRQVPRTGALVNASCA